MCTPSRARTQSTQRMQQVMYGIAQLWHAENANHSEHAEHAACSVWRAHRACTECRPSSMTSTQIEQSKQHQEHVGQSKAGSMKSMPRLQAHRTCREHRLASIIAVHRMPASNEISIKVVVCLQHSLSGHGNAVAAVLTSVSQGS